MNCKLQIFFLFEYRHGRREGAAGGWHGPRNRISNPPGGPGAHNSSRRPWAPHEIVPYKILHVKHNDRKRTLNSADRVVHANKNSTRNNMYLFLFGVGSTALWLYRNQQFFFVHDFHVSVRLSASVFHARHSQHFQGPYRFVSHKGSGSATGSSRFGSSDVWWRKRRRLPCRDRIAPSGTKSLRTLCVSHFFTTRG